LEEAAAAVFAHSSICLLLSISLISQWKESGRNERLLQRVSQFYNWDLLGCGKECLKP
jgi:hypothetical protein